VASVGNFAGAFTAAVLMFYTTQYTFGGGTVGLTALTTASAKHWNHVQCIGVSCRVDVL
jgi:formate/nitrite transporter FocA (FNT family)